MLEISLKIIQIFFKKICTSQEKYGIIYTSGYVDQFPRKGGNQVSTIDRETMSLLVECEDCKEKFRITTGDAANTVTHKKEFNVNGQSIFLTYYDCPKCGRRHYVQIDNATSLNKLKEVSRQFVKLSVLKKKGKDIPQKQSAKFKKARQNLSEIGRAHV